MDTALARQAISLVDPTWRSPAWAKAPRYTASELATDPVWERAVREELSVKPRL
jgi:hypothetical protein